MASTYFDFSDKEILLPEIQEINGMYFRVNPVGQADLQSGNPKTSKPSFRPEESIPDLSAEFNADELDVLYNRILKNNDTFRLFLDKECIPSVLFPMIIGKGGQAKKLIEDETKARIIIPEKKEQVRGKPIEIICYDDAQLVICRRRLLQSAQRARMQIPFTHFICFPIPGDTVLRTFARFQQEVTGKCGGARGFSENLFQTPRKMHITVGTLALFNEKEYGLAADELEECFSDSLWNVIVGGRLTCRIKGLEIMNDDPSEVDVLYGIVDDPTGKLQKVANRIYRHCLRCEPRFLQDQHDNPSGVKLHVTLLNSKFRKGVEVTEEDMQLQGEPQRSNRTFDATEILRSFKDFDFGQCPIDEVHISQRYSTSQDGFYKATYKLKLDAAEHGATARPTEPVSRQESSFALESYGDEPDCEVREAV